MNVFAKRAIEPEHSFRHDCDYPRQAGRWPCPVCHRVWIVRDDGSAGSKWDTDKIGRIVKVTMRYPDGTETDFEAEDR